MWPFSRCVGTPDHETCDNGLFCDGHEHCGPQTTILPPANQVPGRPLFCTLDTSPVAACEDGWQCTDNLCDEVSDTCSTVPNHSFCRSSVCDPQSCDPPTEMGSCAGSTIDSCPTGCQPAPPVCDDHNPCTIDTCNDPATVGPCTHTPRPCLSEGPCDRPYCDPRDGECHQAPLCGLPGCPPCL